MICATTGQYKEKFDVNCFTIVLFYLSIPYIWCQSTLFFMITTLSNSSSFAIQCFLLLNKITHLELALFFGRVCDMYFYFMQIDRYIALYNVIIYLI